MKDLKIQEAFHNLSYYTLSHKDPKFIHQFIVDSYAAQTADEKTKPITLTFALIGLYLHNEKNFTGKEIQNVHILMGKKKKEWPKFNLPKKRGDINVFDVLNVTDGRARDQKINEWSESVWKTFVVYKNIIEELLREYNLI